MTRLLEALIATWAPHACLACGRDGSVLCPPCRSGLPRAGRRCYRCPLPAFAGICPPCRRRSPLAAARAMYRYEGPAKQMVARLKFGYAQAAATEMADMMAPLLATLPRAPAWLIVPVPTASRRVRQRGYDQSVLLARQLADRCPARYAALLERRGQSQQHGASRAERWSARGRSYVVRRPDAVRNARIILVDDVLTTGATLEAAAATLRAAGAERVVGAAFARAELGAGP